MIFNGVSYICKIIEKSYSCDRMIALSKPIQFGFLKLTNIFSLEILPLNK